VTAPVARMQVRPGSFEPPRSRQIMRCWAPTARSRSGTPHTPRREYTVPLRAYNPTVDPVSRMVVVKQTPVFGAGCQQNTQPSTYTTCLLQAKVPTPCRLISSASTPQAPRSVAAPPGQPKARENSASPSICSTTNRVPQMEPSVRPAANQEVVMSIPAAGHFQPTATSQSVPTQRQQSSDLAATIQISQETLQANARDSDLEELRRAEQLNKISLDERTSENNDLKRQLEAKSRENSLLQSEKHNLEQELASMSQKYAKSDQAARNLEGAMRSLESSLEKKVAQKQQEITQKQQELEEWRDQADTLERQNKDIRLREAKCQSENQSLQMQMKTLQKQLQDAELQVMEARSSGSRELLAEQEERYRLELDELSRRLARCQEERFISPAEFQVQMSHRANLFPDLEDNKRLMEELAQKEAEIKSLHLMSLSRGS